MTERMIREMRRILVSNGITPEAIDKSLREFHSRHSYNKLVVVSYFYDAMQNINKKATYTLFRRRKKK